MKRIELFHPRVFEDEEWAAGYVRRNLRPIGALAKDYVKALRKAGFTGGRVVDSGCGFGVVGVEIARAFPGAQVAGYDLAEPLLRVAREQAAEAGVGDRVAFEAGDVQALPEEDDSADLVVNTFMLHIVEDPEAMLAEIERVARPGARLMITDLRRSPLGLLAKKLRTAFTFREALAILQASPLREGQAKDGPFWWTWTASGGS